jgi:spore maturation protein A
MGVIMMMKWIWSAMITLSVIIGIADGRINEVSTAALTGAADAVALFLILLGTICMWSGLMKIAEAAGITEVIAKLLSPITKRLFPDLKPDSEGMQAITMNMTANFLGLGNAATPLGLRAMKIMAETSPKKDTATNSMAMFIVINTASLQLIPTTIAAIRINNGSKSPFDILPCIWLASIVTVVTGVVLAKIMSKKSGVK